MDVSELVGRMRQMAERERTWALYTKDVQVRQLAEARAEVYDECAELTERAGRMSAAS